jgi:hypothetical protein
VRLLRAGGRQDDVELRAVYREVDRLLQRLRPLQQQGKVRLSPLLQRGSAEEVTSDGLRTFAIYHTKAAATRRGDRVVPTDRALLFYYQNRLEGFGLETGTGMRPALSSDHRSISRLA